MDVCQSKLASDGLLFETLGCNSFGKYCRIPELFENEIQRQQIRSPRTQPFQITGTFYKNDLSYNMSDKNLGNNG